MIGELLDETYKVLERLGAGAFGEVYLVEHIHIGRREAIKVLRPEMARDQRLASRFRREARAINRLRHPNIIGIYDFGQLPDGRLYLTMEYAGGEALDNLLKRDGRLDLTRSLHLLHQLASAIDHAHAHGVVHRDLKPNNLMIVDERGRTDVLKVLDFGLAKVMNPVGGGEELTLRGELFGTPEYLAPERMAGGPDDPRSDLYAIGCIAYELVTGKPPFTGARPMVMAQHMQTVPTPPGRVVAGIPGVLDVIITQLLAKDPEQRLQTARQLITAIEEVPGFRRRPTRSVLTSSTGPWADGRGGGVGVSGAVDGRVEIHDEVTFQERGHAPKQIGFADTLASRTEEVRDEVFGALVELGQATVAQCPGDSDDGLGIAIALVHGVRDDRARMNAERARLEEEQERTLQTGREREGSLRFAIAELRHERHKAVASGKDATQLLVDLDYQIVMLDTRVRELSGDLRREMEKIDDRGIELAAAEHDLEVQWMTVHASLRRAVQGRLSTAGATGGPLGARFSVIGTAVDELIASISR